MSASKMSFAGPTIRPSSGSQTPPEIGTFNGTTAAEVTTPDRRMQIQPALSQGQRTQTSDEVPSTGCLHCRFLPFVMQFMAGKSVYLANIATMEKRALEIRELRSILCSAIRGSRVFPEIDQEWDLRLITLDDYLYVEETLLYLAIPLTAAEEVRPACDTTKIITPSELQNILPNRQAATDWPQSQRCTLTCSLHETVLVLWACHQALVSTKHV